MKRWLSILLSVMMLSSCLIVPIQTVAKAADTVRGDVNRDGVLTSDDAIYLLRHSLSASAFPIDQNGDMNGDDEIDSEDALHLLRHTILPQLYPLHTPEASVYFTKNDSLESSMYFCSISLNGQTVPPDYMTDGYTFEYDLKLDTASKAIGIAYLDDDNVEGSDIWNTRPWEHSDYYFETVDYSDVAVDNWYHMVTPTAAADACKGMRATTILLMAAGAGSGKETAHLKNFCIKNANGDVVWRADLSKTGAPTRISGQDFLAGYKDADRPLDTFAPVLRFVVASDMHLNGYGDMANSIQAQNVRDMFAQMNAYAAAGSDGYDRLDAVLMGGDLTDNGIDSEFSYAKDLLYSLKRSETQIMATMGNHDWNTHKASSLSMFESYFGKDSAMTSQKIGGYHFLTVNATGANGDGYYGWKFTDADYAKVEQMVEAAIADTGTEKPIFLTMHIGPRDTVAGTDEKAHQKDGTSEATLIPIFEKYDNLVIFCGHSHFPANDEFSVWQDDYTVINTGSLTYAMKSMADWSWIEYENHTREEHAECYLVEMDANGSMRLRIWNVQQKRFVGEDRYFKSLTKEDFTYTPGRYTADKLFFAQDAAIEMTSRFGDSITFTFPVVPEASLTARAYEVSLLNASGTALQTKYYSAPYFNEAYDQRITATLSGLVSNADYTISVRAVNPQYYLDCTRDDALRSAPLTLPIRLSASSSQDGTADAIELVIGSNSVYNSAASGHQPQVIGSPTFKYDYSIGKHVVSFNGSASNVIRFNDYSTYAGALQDSMTMEFLFKLDEKPSSGYVAIISGQQGAGFGLEIDSSRNATFYLHDGTGYKTLSFPNKVTVGTYYHVTVVFDGSYAHLYINGSKTSSVKTATSMISLPSAECRQIYLGGDVSENGGCEAASKCTIAGLRLYTYALTGSQVYNAYLDMT